jgi:galactitol-specific phosphotransferase system IIB component
MTLKSIFEKPVDRPIEGVIKADDKASLRLEAEEYVLTNEVEKRLESFLDAYNDYRGANGVWVSGFFGSGKSHLLKMLALLLENQEVEGAKVLDLFLTKCGDNEILKGELRRAVAIPSKSILFNIDQKADVISKTEIDALVAVFVKVFDEACGYYGKQPYIAQFERELDRDGLFSKFKEAFQTLSSHDWEWGRMRAKRVASKVDEAYETATGQNVSNILDKFRADYRLSIEDFADQINTYIETQVKDFRLNFFVDEVGQYIAGNVKLMTNLQTISESLATKCRGRAWVIVTAQEDMNSVLGEMGQQESNDFSKIQDRFANRMKLTSADVAEVIQKRLLMKNQQGTNLLSEVYKTQSNNFKTLFDFADGSQTYQNFQDCDHFIHCYPFIPYQFVLFQSAIQNLSDHSAFEGKHSSVGERSMLGVFQQVAIQIGEHRLGQLSTFDLMFEGIRTALKSHIQRAILVAEKHLDNPFAVHLLKALFLVKYVKEFKPTVRNLCVLMHGSFDQDLPGLRKTIEEALNLLEQQTYIQRNGDMYEYLTDEEKDVENEIKNTEIDASVVADELAKMVFDQTLKGKKIRFDENGRDYPFSRKLDDRLHGREYELTIHVISPFHENVENEFVLQSQTMGRDEVLAVMPTDDRLIRDLLMYKQTEKYVGQNLSMTQREAVKRILSDKNFQNRELLTHIQDRVHALMGKADIFVSGNKLELNGEDPQTRVTRGFHELIRRTYPNLRMLRGMDYTEKDVATCLAQSDDGLFGNDAVVLSEAELDMLAHVQSNNRGGVRTTLKNLIDRFEHKPYGWYYASILCILAKLCARGKIEIRNNSNLLEDKALEQALLNTRIQANLILEPQVDYTASQIRNLKQFYEDFFDAPPLSGEAKALGQETLKALKELIHDLKPLTEQISQYPFLLALEAAVETLKGYAGKPYTWCLTEIVRQEDMLLDMKEETLDPIRKFMAGPQKNIYDVAREFILSQTNNFNHVDGDEADNIQSALVDPTCFKNSRMQQVKSWGDALKKKVEEKTNFEIAQANETVSQLKDRLHAMEEFSGLSQERKDELDQEFNAMLASIEKETLIAVIRDSLRQFKEKEYQNLLTRMIRWAKPKPENKTNYKGTDHGDESGTIEDGTVAFTQAGSIKVSFDKAWLADETDVDHYLAAMRKLFLKEIKAGKMIQI